RSASTAPHFAARRSTCVRSRRCREAEMGTYATEVCVPALRWLIALAVVASACATAPAAPPKPAGPTIEQKTAWILRLEDQRILRDPEPPAPPAPILTRGKKVAIAAPPPPPDLLRLLTDPEARIRRRAALAVGRIRLREGVPPLVALIRDADPEVRLMAAFALGRLGDETA